MNRVKSLVIVFAILISGESIASDLRVDAVKSQWAQSPEARSGQNFRVDVEFQDGLWKYRKVESLTVSLEEGAIVQIPVQFLNEPYAVMIELRGQKLAFGTKNSLWALQALRSDFIDGKPASQPAFVRLFAEMGQTVKMKVSGRYGAQQRNLRLLVSPL